MVCSQHLSVLPAVQNAGCSPGSVLKRENKSCSTPHQWQTSQNQLGQYKCLVFSRSRGHTEHWIQRYSRHALTQRLPQKPAFPHSTPKGKLPWRDAGCLTSSHSDFDIRHSATASKRHLMYGRSKNSQSTKLPDRITTYTETLPKGSIPATWHQGSSYIRSTTTCLDLAQTRQPRLSYIWSTCYCP